MRTKPLVKCSARVLDLLRLPNPTLPKLHQLHAHLITSGSIADPFAAARLLTLFTPYSLSYSSHLLFHLPHTSPFLFNSLLRAHLDSNLPLETLFLYPKMLRHCFRPNNYTFSFLLRAAAAITSSIASALATSFHAQIIRLGWESYDFVHNGVIHLYASCGLLVSARRLFDWTGTKDVITWTSIVTGYGKAGMVDIAKEMFDAMPERNAVSWSAMISGYVQIGRFAEAMEVFGEMQREGVRPNHAGIVGTLTACGALGALDQGRWVHVFAERSRMALDRVLGTALLDMYAKCGCMDTAWQVFEKMLERDVFAYTSMISGLSNHGKSEEAIDLFGRMQKEGIRPNEVTFICVLSACGRMGLVDRGREIFKGMSQVYGIEPQVEHYGSFVDLLGRAGCLEEAMDVVKAMPIAPDSYVLGALLNASMVRGDVELAKMVVESLMELGLDYSGMHVLLSNMYASSCKWEDVTKVRTRMEERNVMKLPGCSMIEVDGVACEFVAGDRWHSDSQMAEVMSAVREMDKQLRLMGDHYCSADLGRQMDTGG